MPDTHLVMPRTLSAPYAELLEAETPQTMTASDAPPNGTAAAAAAFARLLASGDHGMQQEPSPITETPAVHPPHSGEAPHRLHALRAMLLGSTTLPALGMTIAEASQKTADLLAEHDGSGPLTDEQADTFAAQWSVLESTVIAAVPHTILDAASILDRIFPDDATHNPKRDIPAVRRVATFLHHLAEAARSASPDETSIIPSIGTSFQQAAERKPYAGEPVTERDRAMIADMLTLKDLNPEKYDETVAIIRAAAALCRAVRQMLGVTSDAEVLGMFALSLRRHAQMLEDMKRSQSLIVGPDLSVSEDGGETPQDTLTGLYTCWVEVRARYLDEGLSEEDHDAAEAELDEIEDRLGLEPVRDIGDAIVKLGYFLTHSNQMLDDEYLPAIDSNSSYPWPRILFLIEEGADRLPADIREPFRAMVTGLRQLMQRHVKLAEETEKRAEAYQLPEQVSQAMQAALERVCAVNATKRGSGTGGETAVEREFVTRARAIDPDRRKAIFGLMDFIVVSAHLDDAMRMYAQEHGLAPQYREWLERSHSDLAREQVSIKTNDQCAKADDAFADTVAAFEAEAPATLALPLEPTGRMVDAGASAAGITPAQFQAAYAAAVEALKLERAA